MKFKKIKGILACCLLVATVGCSKKVEQRTVSEKNNKSTTEENKKETAEVVKENGLEKTPIFTNKELNTTGETGGVKYNYKAIQISKLKFYTQEAADTFGFEKNKELTCITFDVEVENTTDKDINFYPNMAKLITSTKEQIEPNMLLSDDVGGEFLGNVKKQGNLIYILENTKADDIKTLEVRADAPIDAKTYDALGDEIKLNFEVK